MPTLTVLILPEAAGTDQFAGEAELGIRALLATALDDALVIAGRFHHRPAFSDRERERFFAINMFARLAGMDGGKGVPVVRGGNEDGVNRFVLEQLAVVRIGGAGFPIFLFNHGLGLLKALLVDVTNGDRIFHEAIEVGAALATDTDETDANQFAGLFARGGECFI